MPITGPVAVDGQSYLFDDILEFGGGLGLIERAARGAGQLFSMKLHSFLLRAAWVNESGTLSARHILAEIPPQTIARVRDRQARLLLDLSGEGCPFVPDVVEALHAALDELGISPAACTLLQQNRLMDGKLLLVTNTNAPAAEVVQRYKSLADIERGFRALKSEIEIGPVYHRLPKRIRAHALVCFLALVLHRVMRMRLKAQKRDESPQRLLEQLRRIQHQSAKAADGQVVRGLTEMAAARVRHQPL